MGKAQIHGKSGGGGTNPLGLDKLWEGTLNVTGNVEDITSGAVDPDDYDILLIHVEGECTVRNAFDVYLGFGYTSKTSGEWDLFFTRAASGGTKTSNAKGTVLMLSNKGVWGLVRNAGGAGIRSISSPLTLYKITDGAIESSNLHFVVYGKKL